MKHAICVDSGFCSVATLQFSGMTLLGDGRGKFMLRHENEDIYCDRDAMANFLAQHLQVRYWTRRWREIVASAEHLSEAQKGIFLEIISCAVFSMRR